MISSCSPTSLGLLSAFVLATSVLLHPAQSFTLPSPLSTHSKTSSLVLYGKKSKRKGGGGGGGGQQPRQEKQSVKDQRFDAATRQFMFTLTGLSKTLPDKSKKILDDIYLSFYPGAKIGIVGLNGSGWVERCDSSLLLYYSSSYYLFLLNACVFAGFLLLTSKIYLCFLFCYEKNRTKL